MRRAVVLALALAGCSDALDQRLAIVRAPRVLAIVSEPAEAMPGQPATYRALVASPAGPIDAAPAWAYCLAPKPPTEDNAVADGCLDDRAIVALGRAPTVTAALPADGCLRFGPDVPPGGFRPRDADPSGGYYQPVRADDELAGRAFGFTRITCNLPSAPPDVAHDYRVRYVANTNPTLAPLALALADGTPIAVDAVPRGADVTLVASWPEAAVESYLYFDAGAQALVDRREAMRVSWFATAGALAVDASLVDEHDPALAVATTWRTPAVAGPAWLWIVLRDSRGGIATQTIALDVR